VRTLTRFGIVVETVSKCLRKLARREPRLYPAVAPEVIRLEVEREGEGCFALTKASEASRRLPEAVVVLGTLVQQVANPPAATLASSPLLQRVLSEQCAVNRDTSGNLPLPKMMRPQVQPQAVRRSPI
jgi:hypothetical protein